jgi:hypothetical protein
MSGPGPTGATPADFDAHALARTADILQTVVTRFANQERLVPPSLLHHFTSLDAAQKILEKDDIRLTHAEYSNDQTEMRHADAIIRNELDRRRARGSVFFGNVATVYNLLAPTLDAHIFCMSEGENRTTKPQDRLSQWRAYGQNGRGVCISFDTKKLGHYVFHMTGLRINPMIYDPLRQVNFVKDILVEGENLNRAQDPAALTATVGALTFAMPLMKAEGFSEEREWRLIFMPPVSGPLPILEFHPRRDFLGPFLRLQYIWHNLRLAFAQIPALRPNPPLNVPLPAGRPLLPITDVMVGPSGHQPLNLKAMKMLLAQTPWRLAPSFSDIPYRGLG